MKIAILGVTGMLGTQILKTFKNSEHKLIATVRQKEDIKNVKHASYVLLDAAKTSIDEIAETLQNCDWCINCIGIIKPYIRDDNMNEVQDAININSTFPVKLAKASKKTGTKIIQIATDCVWDGADGAYFENIPHNALDVYGKSKSLGEIKGESFYNLRCSIIGREIKNNLSLMDWFLGQPQNGQTKGFTNHLWNGVTTLQFAKICRAIIENNIQLENIQHLVPADQMNKHELISLFAKIFDRQDIQIIPFDTPIPIDRTLQTLHKEQNKKLWKAAGYQVIPNLEDMILEYKESLYS